MRRKYPQQPVVGVGGVVIHQGRVLLVRRARPPLQHEWSIPGGALEVGETLLEALRREMKEETGLEVEPLGLLEVLDRIVRDQAERVRYHYVLIDYLCRARSAAARAASDVSECRWVAPSELAQYRLHPQTLRVVEKAFRQDAARSAPEASLV